MKKTTIAITENSKARFGKIKEKFQAYETNHIISDAEAFDLLLDKFERGKK